MFVFTIGFVLGLIVGTKFHQKLAPVLKRLRLTCIVRFDDDKYAVRWGVWPFYVYKALDTKNSFWRSRSSNHFDDCIGSKEQCEKAIGGVMPGNYGEPVE